MAVTRTEAVVQEQLLKALVQMRVLRIELEYKTVHERTFTSQERAQLEEQLYDACVQAIDQEFSHIQGQLL